MLIGRRSVLKQMVYVSAGMFIFPSCLRDRSKASILVKNFTINTKQEAMLAELTESIIPKTTTPGAKDIYAHLFLLKMMDDCHSMEEQEKYVKGLKEFDSFTDGTIGRSFLEADSKQRAMVLEEFEKNKGINDEKTYFYNTTKRYTIQAYSSAEFYLTNIQVYEMVPSRYHGCVPVKKSA